MIIVNRTFSETTPESAEHGDFSEAGFLAEGEALTFRELVHFLKEHTQPSCGPARGDVFEWYSTGFYVTDYGTLTERETAIHYSRENPTRNEKYWRKAAIIAGVVKGV